MRKSAILAAGALIITAAASYSCSSPAPESDSLFPLPCMGGAGFGSYYYVDEEGKVAEKLSRTLDSLGYKGSEFFYQGLLRVQHRGAPVYVDTEGNVILDTHDMFGPYGGSGTSFSDGVAFIRDSQSGECRAIDRHGEVLFSLDGFPVSAFSEGNAYYVSVDGERAGIINTEGKTVVQPSEEIFRALGYSYSRYPAALAPPVGSIYSKADSDGMIAAFTIDGKQLTDYISTTPLIFDPNGYAVFTDADGKKGLVDKKGNIVDEPYYSTLVYDGGPYYFVEGGFTGWKDKNQNLLYVTESDEADLIMFGGSDLAVLQGRMEHEGETRRFADFITRKGERIDGWFDFWMMSPKIGNVIVGTDFDTCILIDLTDPEDSDFLNDNTFAFYNGTTVNRAVDGANRIAQYQLFPWKKWQAMN